MQLRPYQIQAINDLREAKRRGHPFTITFTYWLSFVQKTGYMAKKGIMKDSWHVDRIDESKGYVPGNLQVLTNSANVRKYLTYQYDERDKPTNYKTKKTVQVDTNEYPF